MWIDSVAHTLPALMTRDLGSYFLYTEGGGAGILMAIFIIVFFLLLTFLLVLWILLPFSVFGVKRLLRECLNEQKKTNRLLDELIKKGGASSAPRPHERGPTSGKLSPEEEALPEILPLDDGPLDF